MANDWTYDLFIEDVNRYNATPRRGVYPRRNASEREKFMAWLKGCVRDFRSEWQASGRRDYNDTYGWIGDAFAGELRAMCFSDYYKEVYNQRPHLNRWYYIHAMGLPMSEDISRTFCADPVGSAVMVAKETRELYESF